MRHIKACHLRVGIAVKLIAASLSGRVAGVFDSASDRADKGLLAGLGSLALFNVPTATLDIVGQLRVGFD